MSKKNQLSFDYLILIYILPGLISSSLEQNKSSKKLNRLCRVGKISLFIKRLKPIGAKVFFTLCSAPFNYKLYHLEARTKEQIQFHSRAMRPRLVVKVDVSRPEGSGFDFTQGIKLLMYPRWMQYVNLISSLKQWLTICHD